MALPISNIEVPCSTYLCLQLSFHLRHFARVRDGAALAPVDVFVVIEERKAQRAVGAPFVGFKITSYTKVQLMFLNSRLSGSYLVSL